MLTEPFINQLKGNKRITQRADVRESVLESRRIYSNLTNLEFAAWYNNRYGLKTAAVLKILDDDQKQKEGGP